jgi:hypothetical protein
MASVSSSLSGSSMMVNRFPKISHYARVSAKYCHHGRVEMDTVTLNTRTVDLTGQTIGDWTVLSFGGYIRQNATWICRCGCGIEKSVRAQYLLGGVSKKCQKCATPTPVIIRDAMPHFYWRMVVLNAKKRDLEVTVLPEEAYAVLIEQDFKCTYSGLPITFAISSTDHMHGMTTASMDRIDSALGYIAGNIQWVHKDINFMKRSMSDQQFVDLCMVVTNYRGNLPV